MAHIKETFDRLDQEGFRYNTLRTARECAALTKPWIQPPIGHDQGQQLPDTEQSLGARGIANLEGRLLLALYPPAQQWFRFELNPEIKNHPDSVPGGLAQIQQWEQELFEQAVIIQTKFESIDIDRRSRRRSGFRSRKRMALSQLMITGDVLEQLTTDWRLKIFRRDQYVTKRDSAGDVLLHVISEKIDPLGLPPDKFEKTGLSMDESMPIDKRLQTIYTMVNWQPLSKRWLVEQEVNGNIIAHDDPRLSPYFSTAFDLAPGENYGRGFVESLLGDLRSHNALRRAKLDHAGLASKMLFGVDLGSRVTESDLTQQSGGFFRCKVAGGHIQDVGTLKIEKIADFSVVQAADDAIRSDLAKAMMVESEIQPRGERVTAEQIRRIALELEGALGGTYTPIADDQQIPLIQKAIEQARSQKLIQPIPEHATRVALLTGLAALSTQVKLGQMLTYAQIVQQLGPELQKKIDLRVMADILARWSGINEPGLIKTNEQLEAENAASQRQAIEMATAQQAIQSAGVIAQQDAAQQPQPGPPIPALPGGPAAAA